MGPGDQDLDRRRFEGKIAEGRRRHLRVAETGGVGDCREIGEIGLNSPHGALAQGDLQAIDRLFARRRVDDQFRQQGVIKRRDLGARLDPAVHPDLVRKPHLGQQAG